MGEDSSTSDRAQLVAPIINLEHILALQRANQSLQDIKEEAKKEYDEAMHELIERESTRATKLMWHWLCRKEHYFLSDDFFKDETGGYVALNQEALATIEPRYRERLSDMLALKPDLVQLEALTEAMKSASARLSAYFPGMIAKAKLEKPPSIAVADLGEFSRIARYLKGPDPSRKRAARLIDEHTSRLTKKAASATEFIFDPKQAWSKRYIYECIAAVYAAVSEYHAKISALASRLTKFGSTELEEEPKLDEAVNSMNARLSELRIVPHEELMETARLLHEAVLQVSYAANVKSGSLRHTLTFSTMCWSKKNIAKYLEGKLGFKVWYWFPSASSGEPVSAYKLKR